MTNTENLKAQVRQSLDRFMSRDCYLLKQDVSERAITHKVAEAIQSVFLLSNGYDVDCEYNRVGPHDIKKLSQSASRHCKNGEESLISASKTLSFATGDSFEKVSKRGNNGRRVYPDIIVHRRGRKDDNLLAIEVKKSRRGKKAIRKDEEKLKEYVRGQLRYKYGLLVVLRVGTNPSYTCRLFDGDQWIDRMETKPVPQAR